MRSLSNTTEPDRVEYKVPPTQLRTFRWLREWLLIAGTRSSAKGRRQNLLRVAFSLVVQIGAIYVVFQAYSLVRRSIWQHSADIAFAHALDVIDAQRMVGLSVHRVELPLQRFALRHEWIIDFFNGYYRNMKLAVFVAAGLAVVFAPDGFRRVRRLFLWATAVAFPWFALYPLAPPRFMGPFGYDFVDTLAAVGGTVSKSGGLAGANQYAAMPSMHIGWSVIAAAWIAVAVPWMRLGSVIGAIHVALMIVAVMATGNHFWLDVVGGFAVVGAAIGLDWAATLWLRRDRPVPMWRSFRRASGWG